MNEARLALSEIVAQVALTYAACVIVGLAAQPESKSDGHTHHADVPCKKKGRYVILLAGEEDLVLFFIISLILLSCSLASAFVGAVPRTKAICYLDARVRQQTLFHLTLIRGKEEPDVESHRSSSANLSEMWTFVEARSSLGVLSHENSFNQEKGITFVMSYKIINAATGKPLATKSMGIMMAVQDCLNSSIQQVSSTADTPKFWEMYDAGNGLVKILNNSCGGLVIDIPYSNTANGTQLQMWFDNSGANQHWNIIDVGNGLVKIASSLAIGKLIDIPGGNTADGVDTQIWDDSNSTHQHWQLVTV